MVGIAASAWSKGSRTGVTSLCCVVWLQSPSWQSRSLLDPVKSNDPDYIGRKIREQIAGSSVTVVLIGNETADSEWVGREIQWSLDKQPANGILGIRLNPEADIPEELTDRGAEILNWYTPDDVHEFQEAIERAAAAARRALLMLVNSASTCSR